MATRGPQEESEQIKNKLLYRNTQHHYFRSGQGVSRFVTRLWIMPKLLTVFMFCVMFVMLCVAWCALCVVCSVSCVLCAVCCELCFVRCVMFWVCVMCCVLCVVCCVTCVVCRVLSFVCYVICVVCCAMSVRVLCAVRFQNYRATLFVAVLSHLPKI